MFLSLAGIAVHIDYCSRCGIGGLWNLLLTLSNYKKFELKKLFQSKGNQFRISQTCYYLFSLREWVRKNTTSSSSFISHVQFSQGMQKFSHPLCNIPHFRKLIFVELIAFKSQKCCESKILVFFFCLLINHHKK